MAEGYTSNASEAAHRFKKIRTLVVWNHLLCFAIGFHSNYVIKRLVLSSQPSNLSLKVSVYHIYDGNAGIQPCSSLSADYLCLRPCSEAGVH